jgi:hypothetical protein
MGGTQMKRERIKGPEAYRVLPFQFARFFTKKRLDGPHSTF